MGAWWHYNNDGWPDLLVTCLSGVVLYRNNGDEHYRCDQKAAGLSGDSGWPGARLSAIMTATDG